ncbi:hypothetical protein B0T25DRAFT_536895 [Lasiosphaeria hispida]|uniref:Uncharacterized protein n=1 Tax=Lasiosphaeria hispida TaxID=260671 RepID=A0AAJ0MFA6_9PEZI|nr:hypothetical protein B0T25DRAFT_536895 [Lasiosphaeria hispida]
MDFRMDIDLNPRKRFRDDELTLDTEEGRAAKKTRQTHETVTHMLSDAFAFPRDTMSMSLSVFDPPSPSDSAPSPPASISDEENNNSFQQSALSQPQHQHQPQSTIISALNHTRRNQYYLRQGYPLSWLYSSSQVSASCSTVTHGDGIDIW